MGQWTVTWILMCPDPDVSYALPVCVCVNLDAFSALLPSRKPPSTSLFFMFEPCWHAQDVVIDSR